MPTIAVIPTNVGIQRLFINAKPLYSISDRKDFVRGIYAVKRIIRTPKHEMTAIETYHFKTIELRA